MQTAQGDFHLFQFLHEPQALLEQKFEDHRALSGIMFLLMAILGTSSWLWDDAIDPVGAQQTISLRLLFLFLLIFPLAFKYIKNRVILELASICAVLLAQVDFIAIMHHLHDGMIYMLAVFVFFFFLPLLMFQGFSLRVNMIAIFLFAAFPQTLALTGFAPGFGQSQFSLPICASALIMLIIQYNASKNYRLRYESEQALALASNTDAMTGVSNRRYFLPRLKQEIIRGERFQQPVCLMILDIDHFKHINDTYGHPTGDLVICALADICRNTARQIDVVARLGGEEFAVLLLQVDLKNAMIAAERLRAAVEKARVRSVNGTELIFTISIGVAQLPHDNLSDDKLVALADAALYEAKASGRNCVRAAPYEDDFIPPIVLKS